MSEKKYIGESRMLYFITALKNKIDAKYVAKESGKGLSTNDYTTAEKTKLSGISAGAEVNVQSDWNQTDTSADDYIKNKPVIPEGVTVDTAMSDSSTNAVQNKVIKKYVDDSVGAIVGIEYVIVETLPATGAAGKIYLVPHSHGTQDIYDEYIWLSSSNKFEKIGTTDIDLNDYLKSSELVEFTETEITTYVNQVFGS